MNILFLGGNRYFGKEILINLLKRKHKVYLINRGSRTNYDHKNLIYIQCDRKDIRDYKEIYENVFFEVIFDNIAYRLDDVKILLNTFKDNFNRYIFTSSSITYLNMHRNRAAKESDWKNGKVDNEMKKTFSKYQLSYANNKKAIEKFLFLNTKIKKTILRIPAVIGNNDFSDKTSKMLNYNYLKYKESHFSKNDKVQYIFKDDLIKIFTKLIEFKEDKSSSYNIANDEIKVKEFYDKLMNKKCTKNLNKVFPLPINSLLDTSKVKKKFNFKFSSVNKVIDQLIEI